MLPQRDADALYCRERTIPLVLESVPSSAAHLFLRALHSRLDLPVPLLKAKCLHRLAIHRNYVAVDATNIDIGSYFG